MSGLLAQERGVAVLVNRPFAEGAVLRRLAGRPRPGFATGIGCHTWAELLLKFVVAHPAVTCAIPATSSVTHLQESMRAAAGVLPDSALCERIAAAIG